MDKKVAFKFFFFKYFLNDKFFQIKQTIHLALTFRRIAITRHNTSELWVGVGVTTGHPIRVFFSLAASVFISFCFCVIILRSCEYP